VSFRLAHNRDREADYSATPPRRSGRTVFPYPAPQVNDSLSDAKLNYLQLLLFVQVLFPFLNSPLCGINVSLVQSINLTSYFPTVDRSDGTSPPTIGTI